MKAYLLRVLVALDILIMTILNGERNETLSAASWELYRDGHFFGFWKHIIDWIFAKLGESDHCEKTWKVSINMTEPIYDRRQEDKRLEAKLQAELDAQVLAENDPSKRANLLVLTAIYRGLVANTAMTHEVREDLGGLKKDFKGHTDTFELHARHEEALLNKGKGAWFALAWFLGIVQIAGGYVIVENYKAIRDNQVALQDARMSDQRLMSRIELLEHTLKAMPSP